MTDLAALVLAAGGGTRLRPLTDLLPKPLCPVGNVPLLDHALGRVEHVLGPIAPDHVAVNAHHLAGQVRAHVGTRVHLSEEQPEALGTAGAVGALRDWLAGRGLLVCNGDAYFRDLDLTTFVTGWDGVRPRLLVVPAADRAADFAGRWSFVGISLLPWRDSAHLQPQPSGLYETVWRQAAADGRLDLVETTATFVDCGTPSDYLRANLLASGGESVVGAGARVEGTIERCVVWPNAVVRAGEHLVEVIRADGELTVPAPQG